MSKSIKRVVSLTLLISAFSVIEPAKYLNLLNDKVYASTDDSDTLSDISLQDGSGDSNINFSFNRTTSSYDVNVKSSVESITIKAVPVNTDYTTVKINGTTVADPDYETTVNLDKGENTIKVKVINGSRSKIYTLNITRGSSSSSSSNLDEDINDVHLSSLELSDGNIDFSSTQYSYDVNVDSSVDELGITAKPQEDSYNVSINGTEVDGADDDYKRTIKLENGQNTITIKVENSEDDSEKTYTLNVTRGSQQQSDSTSSTSDSVQDIHKGNVFLKSLNVGSNSLDSLTSKNIYNLSVNENLQEVAIEAEPENENYVVTIDGTEVNNDNYNYTKNVSLFRGKNAIRIDVKNPDNDEQRTYVLNIVRGTETNTSSDKDGILKNMVGKCSQWVKNNNQWMYNDETGNPLKDSWFTDRSNGNTYYLQANGIMKTGWLNKFDKWYYFNQSGVMKTGWQCIDGNWYYLNTSGAMQTGWINLNDKWYYLYDSGIMAKDTTIDSYALDSNGALIN